MFGLSLINILCMSHRIQKFVVFFALLLLLLSTLTGGHKEMYGYVCMSVCVCLGTRTNAWSPPPPRARNVEQCAEDSEKKVRIQVSFESKIDYGEKYSGDCHYK